MFFANQALKSVKKYRLFYRELRKSESFINSLDTLTYSLEKSMKSGVALEFGVFEGKTLRIISEFFLERTYGFDSFNGLPEDWREGFPKGAFKIDNIPDIPEANLVVGMFESTLESFLSDLNFPIAFVHIDCDLYSSTKYILDKMNSYIEPNCVLLFDELINYPGFEKHEFKALNEWLNEFSRKVKPICYTSTHEQVAFRVIK